MGGACSTASRTPAHSRSTARLNGAESVTAVDVSASALEQARRNAERNGLEGRMEFRQADVFELLTELGKSGEKPWDYIILDPPAFTKSGATVENAARLPGDQPPRHADIAAGRVSGNVLVLALYDRHAFSAPCWQTRRATRAYSSARSRRGSRVPTTRSSGACRRRII